MGWQRGLVSREQKEFHKRWNSQESGKNLLNHPTSSRRS